MIYNRNKAEVLLRRIQSLTPEQRTWTPFPPEWEIGAEDMLKLIDTGWLGMDGFKYCFREYAAQCRRVCRKLPQ